MTIDLDELERRFKEWQRFAEGDSSEEISVKDSYDAYSAWTSAAYSQVPDMIDELRRLKKVVRYYHAVNPRNPDSECDSYCDRCGSDWSDDDERCPECGCMVSDIEPVS